MIVLFTAIFSMMSLIQDRNEGFLLSVLAAPISRSAIVLGKVLGGATLAAIQGWIFLVFAPLAGVHAGPLDILYAFLIIALTSFSLTALGFVIAWPMDSTQAFHAVINLILIPLWLLSGALFPASGASGWLRWVMLAEPSDLWRGCAAQWIVPGGGDDVLAGSEPDCDAMFLCGIVRGIVGDREPPH